MMMSTISVSAAPKDRGKMVRSLRSTLGPTLARIGCVSCRLFQSTEDEQALALITRWGSRKDLDAYHQTDLFRVVLSVIDLSCEAPGIQIDTIAESAGLEYLGHVS